MKPDMRAAGPESRLRRESSNLPGGAHPGLGEGGAIHTILVSVAHQMSQPLTALRGTLELALLKATSVREHRVSEEKALAAAEELTKILQAVRELAEAYAQVGEATPLRLSEVVREAVEEMRPIALSRTVDFQFVAVPGIKVLGDRDRLHAALVKIVYLALMRSSPQNSVRVTLRVAGEEAQVAVEDQGPNFPEGDRPDVCGAGSLRLSLMSESPEVVWELAAAARMVEISGGLLASENLAPRGRRIRVSLPLLSRE